MASANAYTLLDYIIKSKLWLPCLLMTFKIFLVWDAHLTAQKKIWQHRISDLHMKNT